MIDAHLEGSPNLFAEEVSFKESQLFVIRRIRGEVYTIMQQQSGRFIGASLPPPGTKHPLVDAPAETPHAIVSAGNVHKDNSQQWMMISLEYSFDKILPKTTFLFQHIASGRMLDVAPNGQTL